jgi:transposase-like protein
MGDTDAMIHLQALIDDVKGVETVRHIRGPDGVQCPTCDRAEVTTQGRDETQPERQRSRCQSCARRCDELPDTLFAGHHQPLRVWIWCLYVMGLNRSTHPRAQERDLTSSDVHQMTGQWRQGMVAQQSTAPLSGEGEGDEVSIVAGHQGTPAAVANQGGADGAAGSRASADGARSTRRSHRSSG